MADLIQLIACLDSILVKGVIIPPVKYAADLPQYNLVWFQGKIFNDMVHQDTEGHRIRSCKLLLYTVYLLPPDKRRRQQGRRSGCQGHELEAAQIHKDILFVNLVFHGLKGSLVIKQGHLWSLYIIRAAESQTVQHGYGPAYGGNGDTILLRQGRLRRKKGTILIESQSNPVDEVSGDILSNDAEPDEQSLQEPGSVVLTSGNGVSSSVVSEAKLNREQIRAKNKETLLEVINNAALTESAKAEAVAQLSAITDNSEKEIAAELLLEAKGFSDAAVSILDGNVDVVINQTQLTDTQKAQIEDIVKRKTGVAADKITINVCNNQKN